YEMLTGDVPFRGENAQKTLTKHVFDPVVPPSKLRPDLSLSPVLEKVVLRALQKKPQDRYADLREMIDALEAAEHTILMGAAASAPGASATGEARRPTDLVDELPARNRTPLLITAGIGAVALLTGVALAVVRVGHRSPGAAAAAGAAVIDVQVEPGA